jgi:gamma-glutamyltranspeptidase / glutathione hydrolase / leukotriene-C4 hydrolase
MLNLDWGYDISEAIEMGRFHDQLYPRYVDIDDTNSMEYIDALRIRGHNITGV